MNRTATRIILVILSTIVFSSCKLTYRILLGVDPTPHWESTKKINKRIRQYKLETASNFILDTASFNRNLDSIFKILENKLSFPNGDSSDYFIFKTVRKDEHQPTQFRLFDKTGKELFKLVNCYVDPPIPMNWNVDHCFDSFLPCIDNKFLTVHHLTLNDFLTNSHTLQGTEIDLNKLPKTEYYGVILWNDVLIRPSRKLIKTVQKHLKSWNVSLTLIYINNHNAFLWNMLNATEKAAFSKHLHEKEAM